jgi:hypothetical protein
MHGESGGGNGRLPWLKFHQEVATAQRDRTIRTAPPSGSGSLRSTFICRLQAKQVRRSVQMLLLFRRARPSWRTTIGSMAGRSNIRAEMRDGFQIVDGVAADAFLAGQGVLQAPFVGTAWKLEKRPSVSRGRQKFPLRDILFCPVFRRPGRVGINDADFNNLQERYR